MKIKVFLSRDKVVERMISREILSATFNVFVWQQANTEYHIGGQPRCNVIVAASCCAKYGTTHKILQTVTEVHLFSGQQHKCMCKNSLNLNPTKVWWQELNIVVQGCSPFSLNGE